MMASELLNNAIKHSAGDITIRFEREGEKAIFSVSDHGKGFPAEFDPEADTGTGLELVQTLARYDLRGDVHYAIGEGGGACVMVTFPIPPDSSGGSAIPFDSITS
jgi:two-component sensor histidine kinase